MFSDLITVFTRLFFSHTFQVRYIKLPEKKKKHLHITLGTPPQLSTVHSLNKTTPPLSRATCANYNVELK